MTLTAAESGEGKAPQVSRTSWIWVMAALVLLLPTLLFPHPEVWAHATEDTDSVHAALVAYKIALRMDRPSKVPLNGMTYTFLLRRVGSDQIEVVFLPRLVLQRHVLADAAEEIHVVLRRPSMVVVKANFAE